MATTISVEPRLEADAARICGYYGLSVAEAVNEFFRNMVSNGALPFEIKRERMLDEAAKRLKANVAYMQEQSVLNGNSKMTLDEINGIIAEVRSEMRLEAEAASKAGAVKEGRV